MLDYGIKTLAEFSGFSWRAALTLMR